MERQTNLKKTFKLAVRSLLTACSREEFFKAFSAYDQTKQEALYQLLIPVITSMHQNIEEEFESICLQTSVGTALDTVEKLVEESELDILSKDREYLVDVKQESERDKKEEISYLTSMLEKGQKQNNQLRAQLETLKNGKQDSSTFADFSNKVKSLNSNYGQISQQGTS